MAADEKNKKPLVTLDAANPEPEPESQVGVDRAGNQSATQSPNTGTAPKDDTRTLTEQGLENIQHTPDGVSAKDINKAPGSSEVELPASATKYGVLRGAPSSVVLQHMIDAIPAESEEQRKRREKAEKRNALFAAIGDGVSALSNLYFTTKGSPSADQSKSLSKAESDRRDKARKDRESNIEKRLRLLKEQRAELNNLESQRLKDRQLEIMEKYREGQNKIARKRADDYMEYLTKKNQLEKEDKEAEAKRKDEKAKQEQKESDNRIANNNKRTIAYQSRVSNQNKNSDRNTSDMIAKRGGSKYNGPTTRAVYDSKGRLKGYTVSSRGSSPAKPNSGSGSAKSKFSIHK